MKAVIIPCYNEEASIESVILEIEKNIENDWKIIVVNDSSEDDTANIAYSKGVTVLNLPVNLGVGTAFQTGITMALKNGCKLAVKLDGDGQHIPDYIEKIIQPIINNEADIVIGSRFLADNKEQYRQTLFRKLGIKILQSLVKFLTGKTIYDPTSGFRAYNLKAMEFLERFCPNFDYPEPEEIILACKNNLKIVEIPVNMRERKFGTSSITLLGSIYYMVKVILSMVIISMRSQENNREMECSEYRLSQ